MLVQRRLGHGFGPEMSMDAAEAQSGGEVNSGLWGLGGIEFIE